MKVKICQIQLHLTYMIQNYNINGRRRIYAYRLLQITDLALTFSKLAEFPIDIYRFNYFKFLRCFDLFNKHTYIV